MLLSLSEHIFLAVLEAEKKEACTKSPRDYRRNGREGIFRAEQEKTSSILFSNEGWENDSAKKTRLDGVLHSDTEEEKHYHSAHLSKKTKVHSTKLSREEQSSLLAASSNKENKSQILETLTCMTPEASTLNHADKILWAVATKSDRDRKKLLFSGHAEIADRGF